MAQYERCALAVADPMETHGCPRKQQFLRDNVALQVAKAPAATGKDADAASGKK